MDDDLKLHLTAMEERLEKRIGKFETALLEAFHNLTRLRENEHRSQ